MILQSKPVGVPFIHSTFVNKTNRWSIWFPCSFYFYVVFNFSNFFKIDSWIKFNNDANMFCQFLLGSFKTIENKITAIKASKQMFNEINKQIMV